MSVYGTARFASKWDLRRAGMLNKKGLLLGRYGWVRPWWKLFRFDPLIYHNDEGHILTVGAVGSGKSAALAVPNLLHYKGSLVVTDPKGELTAITAFHRKQRLGHKVVILNPFYEEMKERIGYQPDTPFNPLSMMARGEGAVDDARMIAEILLPDSPNDKAFFQIAGRAAITAFLLYLVEFETENLTLPRLVEVMTAPPAEIQRALGKMTSEGSASLKSLGGELAGSIGSEDQWAGILQTAKGVINSFGGDGALAQHLRGENHRSHLSGLLLAKANIEREIELAGEKSESVDELRKHWNTIDRVISDEIKFQTIDKDSTVKDDCAFDPRDLKTRDMTVYVILPGDKVDAYRTWLNLVLVMIGEAIGRTAATGRRVVMIYDEFANLGYQPAVLRQMALYRGAGLKVWLMTQTFGQIKRLYGLQGWEEFLELCDTKQFFKVQGKATAEDIAVFTGQTTVLSRSYQDRRAERGADFQRSVYEGKPFFGGDDYPESYAPAAQQLIRVEDVLQLPLPNQIITKSGCPTILARLIYYYKYLEFWFDAAKNPYIVNDQKKRPWLYLTVRGFLNENWPNILGVLIAVCGSWLVIWLNETGRLRTAMDFVSPAIESAWAWLSDFWQSYQANDP